MSSVIVPRRSVLYMPGSNSRALEKAKSLPADGLILDLEDATAPDKKEEARELVCQAVAAGGYGSRELLIRINGLDTAWGEADARAAAATPCHGILLPKVERPEEVVALAELTQASRAGLWCMLETPLGVLNAQAIASAHPRLQGFVMGTSDLTKDLYARHTPNRLPMLTSLSLCLLAARAHGLAILDGVHLDLNDEAGFRASCVQGLELGFDGKTLIHPKQIEPCNEVFAPDPGAVEEARRVIVAYEAALAEGKNVCLVDGKLVENLHAAAARRLVSVADAISQRS
ncbi:MAG: CoA ester lyase [Polyangiaceae bacterium]|nr:CoA ester lyase [Polyangiaceae bacterium]